MFHKLNVKTLAIIFGVLVIVVVLTHYAKHTSNERNFRESLVDVDTAKITSISIFIKGNKVPVILNRANNGWQVNSGNKTYQVDPEATKELLNGFTVLKSDMLAATDKESWDEYEVNENSGTHIVVKQGDKTMADFFLGKLQYQSTLQNVTTYARLSNETDVYAIKGFLGMNFNKDLNALRYKSLGNGRFDQITKVSFTSPDENYLLQLKGKQWVVNDKPADSTKVINYLQMLCNASGSKFVDDNTSVSAQPSYSLIAESNGKQLFGIAAYPTDSVNKFIVTNSANPGAKFEENKDVLVKRIFAPAISFAGR